MSRIVYRIIPSQATIFLELKAQGVDMTGLTALQYKRQTEYPAFDKAYNKFRYPGSGYTYLGFNLKDPRFADRRVRLAFAHAINKQELLDGVVLGLGREATGPFRPGTWADNPNVKAVPYDPKKAAALLAEAGWTRRNDDGSAGQGRQAVHVRAADQPGQRRAQEDRRDRPGLAARPGRRRRHPHLGMGGVAQGTRQEAQLPGDGPGWGTGADPDQFVVWHSSQSGPDDLNHISYKNPEVDALLESGRSSCVQADRARFYHRLHEVLAEDQPLVFLYWRDALPVGLQPFFGITPGPPGSAGTRPSGSSRSTCSGIPPVDLGRADVE